MRGKRLFGTRGIRGPIFSKITPELIFRVGSAIAEFTGGGRIAVGFDTRTSNELFTSAFTAGALAGGSEVVELGLVPSPCLAFATRLLGSKAGVMITASHNPPSDNGVAFYHSDGSEFTTKDVLKLEELVLDREPERVSWDRIKPLRRFDVSSHYLNAVTGRIRLGRGLRVVVDCANGTASFFTPLLLRKLGCQVITLNSHPDGHFPGRPPEPQPWNLQDLMNAVRELGADLGIAHDGDADRLAVVDERGCFVKHSALIALFAEEAVKRARGGTVVTSINTSAAIEEVVERSGGRVIRTALGRFTEDMRKHGACFAGEPGKLVFLEHGPWADGIFSAAKLVELLSHSSKSLSQLFAERVPDYPLHHEDFPCPSESKPLFMDHMRKHLLESLGRGVRVLDIDGIRLERENRSWVLVRVSGTEPKARVVVEARTPAELEELKRIAVEEARRFLSG